jgi:hypothetical protein
MVTYEALRKDDVSEFRRMFDALGIQLAPELIEQAAEMVRFDKLKKIEKQFGLSNPEIVNRDFKFFRQGKSGTWENYFSEDDLLYLKTACDQYNTDLRKIGYLFD